MEWRTFSRLKLIGKLGRAFTLVLGTGELFGFWILAFFVDFLELTLNCALLAFFWTLGLDFRCFFDGGGPMTLK